MDFPEWWEWELELTPHIEKRMEDRSFTEIELRTMLHEAQHFRADTVEGRWVIQARWRRQDWEIIVEPDEEDHLLLAITAYCLGG